jgi:hypothetical protein
MTLVVIDDRVRCLIGGSRAGAYDAEVGKDGVIRLIPPVRSSDMKAVVATRPAPVTKTKIHRERKGRSWAKIPPGTTFRCPPEVGSLTIGPGGLLTDGRTPNQAFLDAGLGRNVWIYMLLRDGRTAAEAYDGGEWG